MNYKHAIGIAAVVLLAIGLHFIEPPIHSTATQSILEGIAILAIVTIGLLIGRKSGRYRATFLRAPHSIDANARYITLLGLALVFSSFAWMLFVVLYGIMNVTVIVITFTLLLIGGIMLLVLRLLVWLTRT